jgi:hypothetical protein
MADLERERLPQTPEHSRTSHPDKCAVSFEEWLQRLKELVKEEKL